MSFYFRSHMPAFVDAEPDVPMMDFDSVDELLKNDWVAGWNKGQDGFRYCWSKSNGDWVKATLMVEWNDPDNLGYGKTWWVIGYMSEVPIELPEWKVPKKKENTGAAANA